MNKKQKKILKRTLIILVLVLSLSVVTTVFYIVPFALPYDFLTLQPISPELDHDGSVSLEWNDVGDAYKYYVELSKDYGDWHIIKGGITSLNFVATGLADGEYRFKVTAIPWHFIPIYVSNIESVTVELIDEPEAPFMNALDYEIVGDTVRIYLDWEEVVCDSYTVYRSLNYSDCYIILAEGLVLTAYSDVLTEVGVYEYYVSAVSIYGESEPSQTVTAIITEDGVPPEEPTDDYTMLYVLLGVLAILIVPVVILVKRKSKKS